MYTIQDYINAIKRYYGRSRYRKIKLLYGDPLREYKVLHNPVNVITQLNTRWQLFNRTRIEIVVDSDKEVCIKVIQWSVWYVHKWAIWYCKWKHIEYGTPEFNDINEKVQSTRVYTNPDPEFIASLLPKDHFINVKLLYAWVLFQFSRGPRHRRIALAHYRVKSPDRVFTVHSCYPYSLRKTYDEWTSMATFVRLFDKWFLQYIPFTYITSFQVLSRLIRLYYGRDWLMLCLRGGWYGAGCNVVVNSYVLDCGTIKFKFRQYSFSKYSRIIEYYEVPKNMNNYNPKVKLTYWGLWRLLRKLKRG